jgi:hypothetical protein
MSEESISSHHGQPEDRKSVHEKHQNSEDFVDHFGKLIEEVVHILGSGPTPG